jgi:N-acetylmuramoyl-L-alanine amidase
MRALTAKTIIFALALICLVGWAQVGTSQTKRFLVVIDPGHGGWDPGAVGSYGTQEKDINLNIARFIRLLGLYDDEISIVLTRSEDIYIPHRERTGLANRLRADLFVSIHANAHPKSSAANGIEVLVHDDTSLPHTRRAENWRCSYRSASRASWASPTAGSNIKDCSFAGPRCPPCSSRRDSSPTPTKS